MAVDDSEMDEFRMVLSDGMCAQNQSMRTNTIFQGLEDWSKTLLAEISPEVFPLRHLNFSIEPFPGLAFPSILGIPSQTTIDSPTLED